MDSYYNTTHETGSTHLHFIAKAESQSDVILRFFKAHAGQLYTPSQINQLLPSAPIHSVRARITSLERAGHIIKTSYKRTGSYGRREHTWTYPKDGGKRVMGGELLL